LHFIAKETIKNVILLGNMKKVIFAATTDLNYDQRMHRICGSLQGAGFEVTLVGREWPGSLVLDPKPYRQHRLRCFFRSGKFFYLEYSLRLWFFLFFRHFDAYCAVDLDTALPLLLKARTRGGLFGYDAHEYFPEVIEVTGRPFTKKIWELIERFVVPRTDFAYTVSASLARIFEAKYGRPFTVVRNIAPWEPFSCPRKNEKFILYQGAVNKGRGLEAVLVAMQSVEAKLVICGEGDLYHPLRQKAIEMGLADKVQFTGYLLPEQLQAVTRQAYIGLMLLQNQGLSYYYSLANKFFDYLHAGIPQLCVDFPEYRALNDQYHVAELVALDPAEISRCLNYLLQDDDYYEALAANCLQASKILNWQQEEQQLLSLYQQLWQKERLTPANT
jgi:glycosyltransferase involved in cell wall biosynthesis